MGSGPRVGVKVRLECAADLDVVRLGKTLFFFPAKQLVGHRLKGRLGADSVAQLGRLMLSDRIPSFAPKLPEFQPPFCRAASRLMAGYSPDLRGPLDAADSGAVLPELSASRRPPSAEGHSHQANTLVFWPSGYGFAWRIARSVSLFAALAMTPP
jgi:hypothetical protein